MTFSIVGHCEDTGMLGVAITTSSICVGARCPHARAGAGAVSTQNITDPALGPAILDQLENGRNAQCALKTVVAGLEHSEYRQLTVVDIHGNTACHSGDHILGVNAASGGRHCHAAGNLLDNEGIPEAMTKMFKKRHGKHLAERLLLSLEAGLDAGGEQGEVHSAALLVVHEQPFPLVDLRVDWCDGKPVDRLRHLWRRYEPQMMDYLTRALNPGQAPAYGVPGDM